MESENRTRQVLDLLHELLATSPASLRSEDYLKDLARAFGVAGAGLAGVRDQVPVSQQRVRISAGLPGSSTPWETETHLLAKLREGLAECVGTGDSFLVARCPRSGRLLWLEAEGARQWSRAEGAALRLAAAALDQLIPGESPRPAEQQLFYQRLQDAAALSGRLAHAFDNILTGILGFAELTLSSSPPDSVMAQYITEVLHAAQQGVQLTQQFHQFSRSSSVAGGSASVPLVLADVEKMLRATLDKGIALETDVPAELPLAAIASDILHPLLGHLIDNAREAVGSGGKIRLSARRVDLTAELCGQLLGNPSAGSFVEIIVCDSGGGLTPEARGQLFVQPFFSNKPRHRGLGLALVFRTLHAHKAGFALLPGPQGGMEAHVYLPLAGVAGSRSGVRPLSAEVQALREKRS